MPLQNMCNQAILGLLGDPKSVHKTNHINVYDSILVIYIALGF